MKTYISSIFIAGLFLFASVLPAISQDRVDVSLFLDSRITEAQTVTMADLNISTTGRGSNIMFLRLENLENQRLEDLYLYIFVESSRDDVLAEFDQSSGQPFSLDARQAAQGNNNQFQSGFPGIRESINLDGDLTNNGEKLLGQGRLPSAIYTINVSVYQGNNRVDGGRLVGQSIAQFEVGGDGDDVDILMLTPGANLGEDGTVPVRRPFFSWSGGGTDNYRLIVVESDDGESPESLLNQAYQSDPDAQLDFKMFDRRLQQTEITYPAAGARQLRGGETYFWQVFAEIRTPSGREVRSSEIWEFTVVARQDEGSGDQNTQQIAEILQQLLSDEDIDELLNGGYALTSLQVDGVVYRQEQALSQLYQLINLVESGDLELMVR